MVDQQDMFYREVLELSRNNTSKQNVPFTKWKSRWTHRQGSSCKDCLKEEWSGKTFVEEIRCHASFRNAKADTKTMNEGDLILNTIFYGSLTWLRSPRLSSVPVVSVSALTWFITYTRLYYHHLVDHFGTWTISLRRYHLSIKSVLRHGYGLLDIPGINILKVHFPNHIID